MISALNTITFRNLTGVISPTPHQITFCSPYGRKKPVFHAHFITEAVHQRKERCDSF